MHVFDRLNLLASFITEEFCEILPQDSLPRRLRNSGSNTVFHVFSQNKAYRYMQTHILVILEYVILSSSPRVLKKLKALLHTLSF